MTGTELTELLLDRYSSTFDITGDYSIDGYTYQALGELRVTSSRFVLVKQAQLWSANSFEYILFDIAENPDMDHIKMLDRHIREYVEPVLVRKGEAAPEKQHMYSFMTIIMITEKPMSKEVVRAFKKLNYYKNYRFAIRGYSLLRAIAIDLNSDSVYVNNQAKKLKREFEKLIDSNTKQATTGHRHR